MASGGDIGAQLQRSERDALAEAAHAAHAALGGGERLIGIDAQLLAGNVVAGQLAEAELVGVVADALEAEFPAQLFKVEVVALGQRLGHVHAEAGQLDRGVAGDQALRERGHGDGDLDGGAGLGAGREGQLLVDHGQDAAIGGVDDHGGAVHVAQGVDGGLADDGILAGGDVAGKDVAGGKGAGGEALVGVVTACGKRGAAGSGPGCAAGGQGSLLRGRSRLGAGAVVGGAGGCMGGGGLLLDSGGVRGRMRGVMPMRFRQVRFTGPGVMKGVGCVKRRSACAGRNQSRRQTECPNARNLHSAKVLSNMKFVPCVRPEAAHFVLIDQFLRRERHLLGIGSLY